MVCLCVCADFNSFQTSGAIFTKLSGINRAPHCISLRRFHSSYVEVGVVFSYPQLQKLFSLPRTNLAELWYVVDTWSVLLGMGVLGDKKVIPCFQRKNTPKYVVI